MLGQKAHRRERQLWMPSATRRPLPLRQQRRSSPRRRAARGAPRPTGTSSPPPSFSFSPPTAPPRTSRAPSTRFWRRDRGVQEGDLGTVSLGILYTSFTVFSVVAPPVVTRLGPKRALVVGSSRYVLFILANLVPTWYTMVPASLYLGFCASIIWVGQGTYLTSAALSHARENNLPEGRTLGNFTGEFWGIIASTQVIGNLLSLALLRNGKCAVVTGYLTSGLDSATLIVSFGAIVQAVVLFWLLLFYSPMDGVLGTAAPLLIGALWGVGDGMLNTKLNAVVGLMFEDAKESAFAQFKVWECGAVAVIFFLSPHIVLQVMLILMTASLVISFGAFLFLTIAVEKSSSPSAVGS
ncbi:UNC93-like protein 3 isoform X2 [Panicum virgatum]|uniref:UNC93-like protein 3 isoform X2 n=1 Tax=Panicum virgatum TaxID=38727 RepID=UPI0019D60003|nr:UNC93-like protein 3 isoform X2 [Panicum virgatum]